MLESELGGPGSGEGDLEVGRPQNSLGGDYDAGGGVGKGLSNHLGGSKLREQPQN